MTLRKNPDLGLMLVVDQKAYQYDDISYKTQYHFHEGQPNIL